MADKGITYQSTQNYQDDVFSAHLVIADMGRVGSVSCFYNPTVNPDAISSEVWQRYIKDVENLGYRITDRKGTIYLRPEKIRKGHAGDNSTRFADAWTKNEICQEINRSVRK